MPFIRIYTSGVTDINYDLPMIGFLFVLNGLLFNIKTPQGMLVISAGLFKETKFQTTIQGLIVVIVGIILAPFLGIVGVLIGSILSNIYRDIDLLFFISKNVTKLSVRKSAYRIIRIFMSIVVIWIPFLFITINSTNYLLWMANTAIVSLFASVLVMAINFIFERSDMLNIGKRIFRMVKR
jgi:predicted P-loop ATPase/GTPase